MTLENFIFKLEQVQEFYNRHENEANTIALVNINNNEFLLTKKQCIELIITLISDNKIYIEEIKNIIKTLRRTAYHGRELDYMIKAQELFDNYIKNELYNIGKFSSNKFIEYLNNKNRYITNEVNRFNGFKNNQNNFDNMISLLKILNKLSTLYNININDEFLFNTKEDNNENVLNRIKFEANKNYSIVRFIA